MTDAAPSNPDAASGVPNPPAKSMGAWALDVLIWGGVAVVLLVSIDAVDLKNLSQLVTNSDRMELFARDLLRPDFANWELFVAKMWETIQIALWGTFLAVFLGVPLGLAAARNIAPIWVVTPVRWVMNLLRSIPDLVMGLAGRVGGRLQAMDPHRFAGLDPNVLRSMQQERYRSARRSFEELGVPQTPIEEAVRKAYAWFQEHDYC